MSGGEIAAALLIACALSAMQAFFISERTAKLRRLERLVEEQAAEAERWRDHVDSRLSKASNEASRTSLAINRIEQRGYSFAAGRDQQRAALARTADWCAGPGATATPAQIVARFAAELDVANEPCGAHIAHQVEVMSASVLPGAVVIEEPPLEPLPY